ncbi:hypothetical protein [Phytopseudomonas dryadis]|uniref:hypothetical protein n=1 Tax=Phytopseudomonas dryadis TaxID=2487520 RepID=UPI0013F172D5|nr:hypothetical protein [Pseudomonas dryadis]
MNTYNQLNRVEASSYLPPIIMIWLFSSISLGWLSLFVSQPPQLILLTYSNYKAHVDSYDLFCASMMFVLVLMPIAYLLIWKRGFNNISLRKGGPLIFSLMVMVGGVVGLGVITISGNNKISQVVISVLEHLDWFGAVVISFFGLFLSAACSIVVFKNGRSH